MSSPAEPPRFRVIEGGGAGAPPPAPPPPPIPSPWRIGLGLVLGLPGAALFAAALILGAIGLVLFVAAERLATPPAERRRIRQEPHL